MLPTTDQDHEKCIQRAATSCVISPFPRLLDLIDEERAREVQAEGCSCADVLHSARNQRSRHRHAPRLVLHLGLRVYARAMVLLDSALRGSVSGRGLRKMCALLDVPRATLDRWYRWWSEEFPATRLCHGLRGWFGALITAALPGGLLERVGALDAAIRVSRPLRLITPLSTASDGRSVSADDPKKKDRRSGPYDS